MTENQFIRDENAINDIDFPLYKYGIVFRYHINNYFDTEIIRKKQKFKSYCISLWVFLNLLTFLLCLMFIKNGKIPNYFFDITPHFGGITQYFYLMAISGSVLTLRVINLFNHKNMNYFRWIKIIEALKGLKSMDTIGIKDKNEFKIFIKKMNIFLLIITSTTILILLYDIKDLIIYGILSVLKFSGTFYFLATIMLYSLLYYFIVCYYCKIRFKSFNNKLKRIAKTIIFIHHKKVLDLVEEHDRICCDIFMHNKFWRKYSFAIVYTFIPCNLMNLQQLFFENINIGFRGLAFILGMGTLFSLFRLNSIMASINREANKSYKFMFKLLLDIKSDMKLSIKIKVYIIYRGLYKFICIL
jgi:hypothetical protein